MAREINERTRSKIALLVYILLRARTFGEGPGARARRLVSVKWLAEQIGCAARSVERATKALHELGYIGKWERSFQGRRGWNLYYAYDIRREHDEHIWERDAEDQRQRQEAVQELAELLRPEAEQQLRETLEAEVRAELQRELADQLRETIRAELLEELCSSDSDTGVGAVDNNSTDSDSDTPKALDSTTSVSGPIQKSRIRNYPLPLPAEPEGAPTYPSSEPSTVGDEHLPQQEGLPSDPAAPDSETGDGYSPFSLFTAPEAGQSWVTYAADLANSRSLPEVPTPTEAPSDPGLLGGAPAFATPNSSKTPANTVSWLTWYIFQRVAPPLPEDEQERRAEVERVRIRADLERLRRPREPREGFLNYVNRVRQADALQAELSTLCRPLGATPTGTAPDPGRGESGLLRQCAEPDDELVVAAAEFLRRHRYEPARRRRMTGGTVDDEAARRRWFEQQDDGPADGSLYTGPLRLRTIRACLRAVYRNCAHLPEATAQLCAK